MNGNIVRAIHDIWLAYTSLQNMKVDSNNRQTNVSVNISEWNMKPTKQVQIKDPHNPNNQKNK